MALTAIAIISSVGALPGPDTPIFPLTKIRVTILQWKPTQGAYEALAGVGGDYVISEILDAGPAGCGRDSDPEHGW